MPAQSPIIQNPVAYEHGGVKLEGWLACPDATAAGRKRPGVLIVPEWWGVNDYVKGRARQIAELGYVAFVADMFGAGVVTTDARKASQLAGQFYGKPIMAERARAGLDQLLAQSNVDRARVAAIGYCFGGATAQALAYSGAPLVGIVSFHGSLIPATAESAARNRAKFLVCHGAVDPFVPPTDVDAFVESLDATKIDYQFISYAGAVHAFTNPATDRLGPANSLTGKIAYNPAGDRRSWEHMKLFLSELFAGD